jgi:pSer/pThr/pTyr-binding forkhead associated (FHA) protein
MPIITLKFKDKKLGEYQIKVGGSLTIGRHESNDIVIDSLAVSAEHAKIDSVSATFILTDLESTNGTFVKNTLIESHALRNNDVFIIGKHTLTFDRSDIDKKIKLTTKAQDTKTHYLDTDKYRELINKKTDSEEKSSTQPTGAPAKSDGSGSILQWVKKIFT